MSPVPAGKVAIMLTLRKLKTLIDTPKKGEKLPTAKKLRTDKSSYVVAHSKRDSEEVKKPKALGDIRGVSYIYPILWRFGLIRVPKAIEKKMGKQR